MSRDGKYAGVSNADTDDASILDVKAEKEIARIKVGTAPKRVLVIEVPQDQVTDNNKGNRGIMRKLLGCAGS